MASGITEILTYCRPGKRSVIAKCSRVGSCCSNDDGIVHGTLFLQGLHQTCNRRSLLTHSHIDTEYRLSCLVCRTLVEYSVDSNCCLSCLTVADDQLTLSASDRNHGIDRLETGLQRFGHRLTENHARSLSLKRHLTKVSLNPSPAVQRLAKGVDHTADHTLADMQRSDPACAPYGHSLLNLIGRSQQHCSDIIFLKIHDYSLDAILELQEFAGLRLLKSMNPDHAVTHLQDCTDLLETRIGIDTLQLCQQHFRYFTGTYLI